MRLAHQYNSWLQHRSGLAIFFLTWVCAATLAEAIEVNGTSYLNLEEVAGQLGMKASWEEKGKRLSLESEWTHLVFEKHRREMELSGHRVHLGYPVVEARGSLLISESDYQHQIKPILTPQIFGAPKRVHHIILDPGHGGNDPGARKESLKLKEKSLTLDLAKRLKAQLEAQGYEVSLTRQTDTFIPLEKRCQIANRIGADLFLSLHFNASEDSSVSGVETYAFTPPYQPSSSRSDLLASDRQSYAGNEHDPWNTLLGFYVQSSLNNSLPTRDRGLKRARFTVLRDLHMPGLLIEGGFVSNEREGRNIGSAAYRDRIAKAIVEGLAVYERTTERLRNSQP